MEKSSGENETGLRMVMTQGVLEDLQRNKSLKCVIKEQQY